MVDSNISVNAFWIMTILSVVLIVMMFVCKFDFKGYHRGYASAGAVVLALVLCIPSAVFLWPYSTCPKCDSRLPHWFDSYCASCGERLKELPYCPTCDAEVHAAINGHCWHCGTELIYNRDEVQP